MKLIDFCSYQQDEPPFYDLSCIDQQVALFYSEFDGVLAKEDAPLIPINLNNAAVESRMIPGWAHHSPTASKDRQPLDLIVNKIQEIQDID